MNHKDIFGIPKTLPKKIEKHHSLLDIWTGTLTYLTTEEREVSIFMIEEKKKKCRGFFFFFGGGGRGEGQLV